MFNDDYIREICTRVILAKDEELFHAALTELKIAMREHMTNAENRSVQMILNKPRP